MARNRANDLLSRKAMGVGGGGDPTLAHLEVPPPPPPPPPPPLTQKSNFASMESYQWKGTQRTNLLARNALENKTKQKEGEKLEEKTNKQRLDYLIAAEDIFHGFLNVLCRHWGVWMDGRDRTAHNRIRGSGSLSHYGKAKGPSVRLHTRCNWKRWARRLDETWLGSKISCIFLVVREPVWPSGKALGWYAQGPRFEFASALLSLQKLWSLDSLVSLSLTVNETLKFSHPAHLNAEVIPTPIPASPISPSLIILMISVDVKHHVYLLLLLSGLFWLCNLFAFIHFFPCVRKYES